MSTDPHPIVVGHLPGLQRGFRRAGTLNARSLTSSDVISILEAFYDWDATPSDWSDGILRHIEQGLGLGGGAGFLLYDVSREDRIVVNRIDARNTPVGWVEAGVEMTQDSIRRADYVQFYRHEMVWSIAPILARVSWGQAMRESMANAGYADILSINGNSPSGIGCCLFIFAERRIRLTPQRALELRRIACHLSAATRLRDKLAAKRDAETDGIEAIFDSRGRLEYADSAARSGKAREGLQSAMAAREWALGKARRQEPGRALAAWQGLVEARWSLVDHFESDGKRYVLARENSVQVGGARALSERERQVVALAAGGRSNKVIAYELGISHSTVRVLIARARVKLNAQSRSDLCSQYSRIAGVDDGP